MLKPQSNQWQKSPLLIFSPILQSDEPLNAILRMASLFDYLGFFGQSEQQFLQRLRDKLAAALQLSEAEQDRLDVLITQVCVKLNAYGGSFALTPTFYPA